MGTKNKTVSDDNIISVFKHSDEPFMTVPEVAQELPISRQAVHKRVKQLHASGELEKKETGHTAIWWLPDKEFP